MHYTIYRCHQSSYQGLDFIQNEKKAVQDHFQNVKYTHIATDIGADNKIILLTNTHVVLEELPDIITSKVELIIHPNSGHDNFSSSWVKKLGKPVILGNTIRSKAVVEYTLSCLFQHFTLINNHHHWNDHRIWDRELLSDQKIIIFGHGHIGETLTKVLSPLCENLHVIDPKFGSNQGKQSTEWNSSKHADANVIILANELNESSIKLIDELKLNTCAENCLIINPARGKSVDQEALIKFLKKFPKAKAYLDVFEEEPFSPGAFMGVSNINKTSHIAGVYSKLNENIIQFEIDVLSDFFQMNSQSEFDLKYKKLNLLGKYEH